jgi:hypothetical protein
MRLLPCTAVQCSKSCDKVHAAFITATVNI